MPPKFQEMLKEQRQNPETSRAGLKWEESEDATLMTKVKEGVSFEAIAKILQRTEGSVKTRLITYAIDKMENNNESLEDMSALIKISEEDIQEYQRKKKVRDEKRLTKIFNNKQTFSQPKSSNVTLSDLHALLVDIKNEISKLTG